MLESTTVVVAVLIDDAIDWLLFWWYHIRIYEENFPPYNLRSPKFVSDNYSINKQNYQKCLHCTIFSGQNV